ncbi:MAG: hypothetical protein EAX96_09820 [Candidatus Lokiarchaeota archaeon]|nr:hypothetical protein [Candidatus Lokiarchaeota archaeon]
MRWIEKIIIEEKSTIRIFYTNFINGILIFITDSENKIVNIGIGVPLSPLISKTGGATNPLVFGIKNELITKTFVMKIAEMTNKIVIAIINLSEVGIKKISSIINAISEILKEI